MSHIATIMACHGIGQLTPSAFVSTYHTIVALLFPTAVMIMKTKMNCPCLGAVWLKNIKTLNLPIQINDHFCHSFNFLLHYMVNGENVVNIS